MPTPGIRFLARTLLFLSSSLLALYGLIYALEVLFNVRISPSLNIVAVFTLFFSIVFARVVRKLSGERQEAARLEAKLIPEVEGKWLGNVDVILQLGKDIHEDYLGMFSSFLLDQFITHAYA